jgi:hypothetical protein
VFGEYHALPVDDLFCMVVITVMGAWYSPNTMSDTSGEGIDYHSGAHNSTPRFSGDHVARSVMF